MGVGMGVCRKKRMRFWGMSVYLSSLNTTTFWFLRGCADDTNIPLRGRRAYCRP